MPKRLSFGNWDLGILWKLGFGHWIFQQGFTLLEMIISIGIFSVVVVAAIGITIGVSNAHLKAANTQATQDNIRFSVELITKEMRTGSAYDALGICGAKAGEAIRFLATSGGRAYYLDGTTVRRIALDLGTNRLPEPGDCRNAKLLFADEVAVEHLRFTVGGQASGPADGQPWVMISLSVRSRNEKRALESRMDLQTTVVQRLRDL